MTVLLQSPEFGDGRRIGYARVSTADQKLDMQLDFLARAECHKVFWDQGVSGAKENRPGLDEALRELVQGDMLIVFKLDRLGRSVLHLADLLTRLDNEGVHFCSITESINTTTPGGKLVFHIFAAVAEFQRNLIRENTITGIEAARKRGSKIGRPRLIEDLQLIEAHRYLHQEGASIEDVARLYNVSRHTMQRGFRRLAMYEPTSFEPPWTSEQVVNDNRG